MTKLNITVTVQRTQKLREIGKPLVYFTDKAKPYLLPITKGRNPDKVQVVKVADKDLVEVTGISTNSNEKNESYRVHNCI